MINIVLMKKSKELEDFCYSLGYEKTWFLDSEFVLLEGNNKKKILQLTQQAHARKIRAIYSASDEEMLRFVLEKTDVDLVCGFEKIHPKDSTHFLRGGLDQILCKIAHDREKILLFSFALILNSTERGKLLGRMMFNISLCKKYGVKFMLNNFCSERLELRSAKDLEAMGRVLGI
jgi:RNase P/RNase MRP subunit p30